MADNKDIKRLNYFTGQFLEAQDFQDEQSYHIGMRRRLNQLLYSPGIVDNGFIVTKTGDKRIKVTAGFAVDANGQELILLAEEEKDVAAFDANATVFVAVRYDETKLEDDKRGTDNITGFIRFTEKPEILLQGAQPTGSDLGIALLLAKLQLDASGNIQAVDTSVRQLANLHFNGDKLGIGTSNPAEKLHISGGKLQLDGNQQVTFTDTPASTNLKLQLRSGCGLGVNDTNLYFMSNTKYSWLDKDGRSERMSLSVAADGGLTVTGTGNSSFVGNLGIGTIEPKFAFDVKSKNGIKLGLEGNGGGQLVLTNNPNDNKIFLEGFSADGTSHASELLITGRISQNLPRLTFRADITTVQGSLGIGTDAPGARLDVNANSFNANWLEAIRFSNSEHSAITHPGGGLLFGMHKNRNFYFADIMGGFQKYVMQIEGDTGNVGIGTETPTAKLHVNGTIRSPMWRVNQVFDRMQGPLPITASFNSGGGTLIVFVSGTAFRKEQGLFSLIITIDNAQQKFIDLFTNEGNSHKTFPSTALVFTGYGEGVHNLKIAAFTNGTLADANDRYYATVLELPF